MIHLHLCTHLCICIYVDVCVYIHIHLKTNIVFSSVKVLLLINSQLLLYLLRKTELISNTTNLLNLSLRTSFFLHYLRFYAHCIDFRYYYHKSRVALIVPSYPSREFLGKFSGKASKEVSLLRAVHKML